jgi:hypothetical protein
MSTLVTGTTDRVFAALRDAYDTAASTGATVHGRAPLERLPPPPG